MLGVGLSLFLLSSDYQKSFLLENLSSTRCDPWQWDHPPMMVFLTQKKCAIGSGHQLEFLGVAVVLFYHFTQKIKWIHIEVKYWVGLDKARRRWQGGEGGLRQRLIPLDLSHFPNFASAPAQNPTSWGLSQTVPWRSGAAANRQIHKWQKNADIPSFSFSLLHWQLPQTTIWRLGLLLDVCMVVETKKTWAENGYRAFKEPAARCRSEICAFVQLSL